MRAGLGGGLGSAAEQCIQQLPYLQGRGGAFTRVWRCMRTADVAAPEFEPGRLPGIPGAPALPCRLGKISSLERRACSDSPACRQLPSRSPCAPAAACRSPALCHCDRGLRSTLPPPPATPAHPPPPAAAAHIMEPFAKRPRVEGPGAVAIPAEEAITFHL